MYRKTENFTLTVPYHTPITLILLDTLVFICFHVPVEWLKRKEHTVAFYGGLYFPLHGSMQVSNSIHLCSAKNNAP